VEKLIEGLRYFRSNILWQKKELFEEAVAGQSPFAMLVACSDSRLLFETLLQLAPGDLFIARNAGNFVPPPEEGGGEAAAIEYAVNVLKVTDLIVCGHYRCGAVNALFHPPDPHLPALARWLHLAAEAKTRVQTEFASLSGEAKWDKAVELNVLVQLQHLSRHPAVAARLATGAVRLHAWVVRFETGQIFAECPQLKQFVPLLELPMIRAASPQSVRRPRKAAFRPASGRAEGVRWSAGSVAMSACSLLALACVEGCGDGSARRVRGAPPEGIPLVAGDHAVVSCSGSCDRPAEQTLPQKPVDSDWRVREWK